MFSVAFNGKCNLSLSAQTVMHYMNLTLFIIRLQTYLLFQPFYINWISRRYCCAKYRLCGLVSTKWSPVAVNLNVMDLIICFIIVSPSSLVSSQTNVGEVFGRMDSFDVWFNKTLFLYLLHCCISGINHSKYSNQQFRWSL